MSPTIMETKSTIGFLNTTQRKLPQLTHFVSFLAVYDSLGTDRRALARSFQDFFQSILPQAAWVIAIPTNPGIQDDSESCGAYVMFNAWCIAQYGQAYHYTLSSRRIRNCVLHELLENCQLQTNSDRKKCRVCRKAINRKKMNTQETAGKCTVCKSVVHVTCVSPEVATEMAAAFKCKDLRLRYWRRLLPSWTILLWCLWTKWCERVAHYAPINVPFSYKSNDSPIIFKK